MTPLVIVIVVHPMIGYRQPNNKGTHVLYAGGKYDALVKSPNGITS
jgi:hypothetical protein